jgi:hypothetical protein
MPVSKLASLQAISLFHGMQGLWEKQNQNHFFSFVNFVRFVASESHSTFDIQHAVTLNLAPSIFDELSWFPS